MENNELIDNISCLHTTELGAVRIKKNLGISEEPVQFCKNVILDRKCMIYRQGKNWYCENNGIRITVNAYSYTIITAHKTRRSSCSTKNI